MSSLDFPIALRLRERQVLVVGAGTIATHRIEQLLEAGAWVHVVAPEAGPEVIKLADEKKLTLALRRFDVTDCAGAVIIFTATDDPRVTRQVVAEARRRGVLVNAADLPELCDFHVPSFGRRGPVTVAVSTSGLAPALARAVKDRALAAIGPEWGTLARLLGRLRKITPASPARTRAFGALIDEGAAGMLARGERAELWKTIRAVWPSGPGAER